MPTTIKREPPESAVEPTIEKIIEWENEGGSEALDGCWIETDGVCEHGYISWFSYMTGLQLVEITQGDIQCGHRNHPTRCPLSLAIKRHTELDVFVFPTYAYVGDELIYLSASVQSWVYDFDMGNKVEPARFKIFKE